MTIAVHIKPRADRKYDIYTAHQSVAGEPLVNSSQGYENQADAERIARRLWGADDNARAIKAVRDYLAGVIATTAGPEDPEYVVPAAVLEILDDPRWQPPEPVDLTVTYLDGTGRHEMIR